MTIEVYNPSGAIEITEVHAPRLPEMQGRTVCELSDRVWEDFRIFPHIREMLKQRFPDINIVPYTEFPNIYGIKEDDLVERLENAGADAVIVGNAA